MIEGVGFGSIESIGTVAVIASSEWLRHRPEHRFVPAGQAVARSQDQTLPRRRASGNAVM